MQLIGFSNSLVSGLHDHKKSCVTLGSEPDQKTLLYLFWRRRPFSLPLLVGDEEGKGLVAATVSLTCASTKIVALQSDCRIAN